MLRPRLLYFNGPWEYLGERIRVAYAEPLEQLLAQDFEVISVQGDCDFKREVERHRPDLALFHTGIEAHDEPDVTIARTDAFPELPRIGYVMRDPFTCTRTAPMNRLRAWKVNQVFTAFRASDSPAPFFRDSIYVPWWIDDRVFRDFGETKSLPLSLTGGGWFPRNSFYPWRFAIAAQALPRFAVFHAPIFLPHQDGHAYVGDDYARLLNRSYISAGCGSINRFLTRKPLEIPACRACLLAEETEALKAIGFRDGVNCVFATADDVVAKVQELLDDPERLAAITDAGYRLVHEQHTQRNRRMFIEWFRLWQKRSAGQRIVQRNPFEPLEFAGDSEPVPASTFPKENPFIEGLLEGYRRLATDDLAGALSQFEATLRLVGFVAEARLGAAICHLRMGQPGQAAPHLIYAQNFEWEHSRHHRYPDVLVQAHLAAALLLIGKCDKAIALLERSPELRHPALNALRWFVSQRPNEYGRRAAKLTARDEDETQNIETVHLQPAQGFRAWLQTWRQYLGAAVPEAAHALG